MIISGQTEAMLIERAASKFSGSPGSLVAAAKRDLHDLGQRSVYMATRRITIGKAQ